MKKQRLNKLVFKNGDNKIDSILTKDKMKHLVGGGYCSEPGLACYGFSQGCSNLC